MDFRTIFLDYFQKCLADEADIDISIMRNMASGDESSANSTLKELMLDGIVISIPEATLADMDAPLEKLKKLKLTEFGVNYLNHRNKTPHSAKILADLYAKTTNIPPATINTAMQAAKWQDYAKNFHSQLDKYKSRFESSPPENINSAKALRELSTSLPRIKDFAPDMRSGFKAEEIQKINAIYVRIGDIASERYGGKGHSALSKFLKDINNAKIKIPQAEEVHETKTHESTDKKDIKTFTFEGILGQNCGNVVKPSTEDEKRIQVKGFKVKNGIRVLRGFAKSSELAAISQADKNYQRDENTEHLAALSNFMNNIKASAKYLPEVTLVARGYESLDRVTLNGSLTDTQKGELNNLEYFRLIVKKNQLYRIDGNHRLEALQESDYYIPFAIIIWEKTKVNQDDEAFLFYFLNAKAKRLTTEENLKGLVVARTWADDELKTANVILPYIKYFRDNFEKNPLFNKKHYQNSLGDENAKTQILNILELILKEFDNEELPFDKEVFGKYIVTMQEILSQRDRFQYLRSQFRCFPQFVFYTLYKNEGDSESSIKFIDAVDKWAEYYKHDSNSLALPNKMYHNASNQLDRDISIFVAMPYYDDVTVTQFNTTFRSLVDEIKQEYKIFGDKLKLCPIMTYKAESTDILTNMDKQIGECDIFIADISNHGSNKVNPNVMFELGRVYDRKKFILIRNKDNDAANSAFDIRHFDYVSIDFGMGFDTSIKSHLKPRIVNILKNIIGFC